MRSNSAFRPRVAAATANAAVPSKVDPFEACPSESDSAPATVESAGSTEPLFRALDGRWITVAGERWRTEVYGVMQVGECCWVQVGLHGARDYMITLRTVPTSGISQLMLAMTAWLAGSEPGPDIVSVG